MTRASTRGAPLVLASGSQVRRQMLESAGLALTVSVSDVDERPIAGEDEPARARRLAIAKARAVSLRHPGSVVVGADQVGFLDDGRALEKPRDAEHARAQLVAMRGRAHSFVSCAAVVRDGEVRAVVEERATVRFRAFSDDELTAHVARGEWKGSCGGYQIEHAGVGFVAEIAGSYHAILGLPLVPLLAALRTEGVS